MYEFFSPLVCSVSFCWPFPLFLRTKLSRLRGPVSPPTASGMLLTQALGYSSTCLFVCVSLSSSVHSILQSWHGDNLRNIKLNRIWFADGRDKVKSTTGSCKVKINTPRRKKNKKYKPGAPCAEKLWSKCLKEEIREGKGFKDVCFFSWKRWKESFHNTSAWNKPALQ